MGKILFVIMLVAFCAVFRAPTVTNATTPAEAIMNATTPAPAIMNATTPAFAVANATTPAPITNAKVEEIDATNHYEVSYHGTRSLLQFREDEVTDSEPQCIEIAYEENGATNFYRGCYYAPADAGESEDECRTIIGSTGTIVKCNICTTDLCNSSGKATPTIASIAASFILTVLYFKQSSAYPFPMLG